MISVAAILAGGKGTRLLPRSGKLPKCLMEFGGKPFILHQIDWLIDQGMSKIFVCTGYKHELIESFLSDQHYLKNLGLEVKVNTRDFKRVAKENSEHLTARELVLPTENFGLNEIQDLEYLNYRLRRKARNSKVLNRILNTKNFNFLS